MQLVQYVAMFKFFVEYGRFLQAIEMTFLVQVENGNNEFLLYGFN